ncbi:hypothetical protein IWZ00DRAFT_497800 [Phyllosticta capitalensis]
MSGPLRCCSLSSCLANCLCWNEILLVAPVPWNAAENILQLDVPAAHNESPTFVVPRGQWPFLQQLDQAPLRHYFVGYLGWIAKFVVAVIHHLVHI